MTALPLLVTLVTLTLGTLPGAAGQAAAQGTPVHPRDSTRETGAADTVTFERTAAGAVELRAPVPLRAVVVTPAQYGMLQRGPAGARTLTREQLLAAPQLGEDLFRAIGRLPGISASDFSAAFSVRGAAPEDLLVTLDGVRLYEPFHLKDFDGGLSIVDIGAVGGIELNTGGFGARYGDGLSGVMEIHTIEPEPGHPTTEVALSLTNVRATSRGRFADDRGAWLVAARQGFLEYALRLAGEGRDVRPRYQDLLAKVTYEPAPGHELALHTLVATDGLHFVDPVEPTLVSGYGSRYLWGSWNARLGERVTARTVASVTHLDWARDGERASWLIDDRDLTVRDRSALTAFALRQDWSFEQSPRAVLTWGIEAQRLRASHDYAHGRMTLHGQEGRLVISRDSVRLAVAPEGTTMGAYVAQRLRPFDALTVELGVRADRYVTWRPGSSQGTSPVPWDRTSHVELGPRASAAWSPTIGTTLRAAWGRYARRQGVHELQVSDGLAALFGPDLAEHRVAGVEHHLGGGVTTRLEAYDRIHDRVYPRYVSMEDALDLFPETVPGRELVDATSSRARGVELFVARDAGGPLTWWASYALAHSADLVAGRQVPSPLDQRHTFTAGISYEPDESWRVSVAGIRHSGWPATPSAVVADTLPERVVVYSRDFAPRNSARLPPYHRVDVRIAHDFHIRGGRLSAFVDVFNVFGHRNPRVPDPSVLPLFGRRFDTFFPRLPSFGATWQF
ncbi:MAG TPA: TonB-dependent receptor [Gemmatimonadaceae bacterium]|nr:TonB-dependent receptor [Gemmatimonadaceae bacterium]